ncbi:hypothetical protein L9F63_002740, partial [Diploptera punctata]
MFIHLTQLWFDGRLKFSGMFLIPNGVFSVSNNNLQFFIRYSSIFFNFGNIIMLLNAILNVPHCMFDTFAVTTVLYCRLPPKNPSGLSPANVMTTQQFLDSISIPAAIAWGDGTRYRQVVTHQIVFLDNAFMKFYSILRITQAALSPRPHFTLPAAECPGRIYERIRPERIMSDVEDFDHVFEQENRRNIAQRREFWAFTADPQGEDTQDDLRSDGGTTKNPDLPGKERTADTLACILKYQILLVSSKKPIPLKMNPPHPGKLNLGRNDNDLKIKKKCVLQCVKYGAQLDE